MGMHFCPGSFTTIRIAFLILAAMVLNGPIPAHCQQPAGELLQAADIFAPGKVLQVSITMEQEDWLALCSQTRDFLSAIGRPASEKVFTYFPADITIDGKTIEKVGIRKKGFLGSLDSARPSLKIKFDEFQEQEVSAGFDRLTLNNNKQDPSRICQYLSYKFFNDSGYVAPRCSFARVTVNGKDLGIYSNVESIEKPFLEERFGDGRGALYEGTTTDLMPDYVARLEAKNKAAKHREVERLAALLDGETVTLAEVEQLLDIEMFVRYWAMESLIGFWDGYNQNQNNYFLYHVPRTGKLQFVPWGMDAAFMDTIPLPQLRTANQSVYAHSVLANRLYRHPEVQELYATCMRELLDNHWNEEAMIAEIDELVALVRSHSSEEIAGFDLRVAEIKKFIQGRRATIENELKSGRVEIKHGVRRPIDSQRIGSGSGSFATQWNERAPKKPAEAGTATLRIELNGEVVEFSKLGVTSGPSQDVNSRESDGRLPPTVSFHGIRKSDQKQWLLMMTTSSASFQPSAPPAQVSGIIIEGNPFWFFAKMLMGGANMNQLVLVSGTITFDQAAREESSPVSGQVELEIGKFQGGDYLPIR